MRIFEQSPIGLASVPAYTARASRDSSLTMKPNAPSGVAMAGRGRLGSTGRAATDWRREPCGIIARRALAVEGNTRIYRSESGSLRMRGGCAVRHYSWWSPRQTCCSVYKNITQTHSSSSSLFSPLSPYPSLLLHPFDSWRSQEISPILSDLLQPKPKQNLRPCLFQAAV